MKFIAIEENEGRDTQVNCVSRFPFVLRENAKRLALFDWERGEVSYEEFAKLIRRFQRAIHLRRLKPGSPVFIVLTPGIELYALVFALAAMDIPVLFLEPWLSAEALVEILREVKPQAAIGGWLGRAWLLHKNILPKDCLWFWVGEWARESATFELTVLEVPANRVATITYSSGTQSLPKRIARTHGKLWNVHEVIEANQSRLFSHMQRDTENQLDLTVFSNLPLFTLLTGRGSLLLLQGWKKPGVLRRWQDLPQKLKPANVVCGPTILNKLISARAFPELQGVLLGGALGSTSLYKRAFKHWTRAELSQIYGSSEAEPVCTISMRESLLAAQENNEYLVRCLGKAIPEIQTDIQDGTLKVKGPHVFSAQTWHNMEDRVGEDSRGRIWFEGRSFQDKELFSAEQRAYFCLQSDQGFLHRSDSGQLHWIGNLENEAQKMQLKALIPGLTSFIPASICYDRRHHARIDRRATLHALDRVFL